MKLIVYPVEGLANRMRVIDSAIRYSIKSGSSLSIRWYRDPKSLNCRWDDLFEPFEYVSEAGWDYHIIKHLFRMKRRFKPVRLFFDLFSSVGLISFWGTEDWAQLRDFASKNKRKRWVIIQSFSTFCRSDGEPFQSAYFRLNPELRQRTCVQCSAFGEMTIGVHIRRTDNGQAIIHSPVAAFIDRMEKYLTQNPEIIFFVCSDSDEVKKEMLDHFGAGHIIVPLNTDLSRNTREGMLQAATEMFSLSATDRIIGSYYSSFSEVASAIGDVPLEQINVLS